MWRLDLCPGTGPEIHDWGVRDGKVWIDTSAVNHVNFVCGNIINDGITVLGERFKDTLSHAKYQLKGHETYVRVGQWTGMDVLRGQIPFIWSGRPYVKEERKNERISGNSYGL